MSHEYDYSNSYYTVLQYMPDRARREAVNIGVAYYRGGSIYWKITDGVARALRFFPGTEVAKFRKLLSHADRCMNRLNNTTFPLESLDMFIKTRPNDFQLTELRSTSLSITLDSLYEELVND